MSVNYFTKNIEPAWWTGRIVLEDIPEKPNWRRLKVPVPCGNGLIKPGFEFNGASVPRALLPLFPKWKHPVATCRHDFRCLKARTWKERRFADNEFRKDVGLTVGKLAKAESFIGYFGVTLGSSWWFLKGKITGAI